MHGDDAVQHVEEVKRDGRAKKRESLVRVECIISRQQVEQRTCLVVGGLNII